MPARVRMGVRGLSVALLLSGCLAGNEPATKRGFDPQESSPSAGGSGALAPQTEVASKLIADLQSRQSILPPDGSYSQVAASVIEASKGASVAELRVARLKAQARARNWLPQIGPSINLTSLAGLATSLLLEQALFDNGRRKAERSHAAADVEIAAVTLASELNQRVYDGLSHYVLAEKARAQIAVSQRAVTRLAEYDAIISERLAGGVADRSEQQVIRQHLTEMQATLAADREALTSAMAELAAMSVGSLDGLQGLDALPPDGGSPEPLSVVRVRGEGRLLVAEANIERAEMLPGLRASAGMGGGGIAPGLQLGGGLMNAGTRANIDALAATGKVAGRRTAQAAEDAARRIVTLERRIATLKSRETEGRAVLKQAADNLDLFAQQYKAGRRTLLELVSQYDAFARLDRDQTGLRHEAALLRLEIARDRGQLVDGARM